MSKPKTISRNLNQWDQCDDPLAPLTECQKDSLSNLETIITSYYPSWNPQTNLINSDDEKVQQDSQKDALPVERYQELLQHYLSLERKYVSTYDMKYNLYLNELKSRRTECEEVCSQIEEALNDFSMLYKQYTEVSGKTTSLYEASEQLISDQKQLNATIDSITEYVRYFKEIDVITEKLDAPTLSINSEMFFNILDKIDTNINFMQNNSSYNESGVYLIRYRHCQSKAIALIQNYIFNLFSKTTESILNLKDSEGTPENADAALALFYGRFQTILSKTKPVIEQIEAKSYKRQEYDSLLLECHQHYWSQRGLVLGASIQKSLNSVREKYNGDHCSLVRHSCALLLHASIDEHRLFYEFFSKQSSGLTAYLESLCTSLYDALRPFIIHINHLETLAEICCILRIEMLDEHVQNNFEPLEGFGNICLQLLHDVQERLVFRAHLYLQSDVLNYNPSAGDLAYPEKLKMMEDIAESIREETRQTRMKKISVSSTDSSALEPVSRNHIVIDSIYQKTHMGNSPADLHGMWYPTVRRTLVCLSRLYRCVDRSVFQSLSQEAISLCVQSIENARQEIEKRASTLDAELFQIKHLLILREQIAPFQVDFTIKEYSLDFSKVKTAAFGLLEKSSRLFTLSNNALLQFLLEGAPQMKEQLIDSRKHVDAKLKFTCQRLIQHATYLLIYPVIKLLEKDKLYNANSGQEDALGSAQEVATIVADVLRIIKFKCPEIQQSMQLYLANKETEFILFKPVKNNICAAFTQLHQVLTKYYNAEDLQLIACPLPEQISVMLSSTTLTQGKSNRDAQSTLKKSQSITKQDV
ncbi:conserved oligomeric Golgi complex subunit 3 [Harpegnathos saltator]|uniref:Conserved oligomeric Golgi complex subunit 3 n=1 Tax=Harpegnathos saltator TaxID=610380 RepID=E2BQW3_HARSA|nr:conserved oligomeric Golgi complex subunit 3 [Harpegnathos saltator]EFN81917.1 Conserved oligomeric Golgi complex subunit 3 [Harpegnathos saltator]